MPRKKSVEKMQKDFGFCNYSPFDIETMLPTGFVRLFPTSQDTKYVIDFINEKTGKTTSYNFYFANFSCLSRLGVTVLDVTADGGVDILTTDKLAKLFIA